MEPASRYFDRFTEYFNRDIANQAAKTLANGVEIEIVSWTYGQPAG